MYPGKCLAFNMFNFSCSQKIISGNTTCNEEKWFPKLATLEYYYLVVLIIIDTTLSVVIFSANEVY